MKPSQRTRIGGPATEILIDGRAYEEWTSGELLDLTSALGDVCQGAAGLIEGASTPEQRYLAMEELEADRRREVAAFRALGYLRLALCPKDSPTSKRYYRLVRRSKRAGDEAAEREAQRMEYVLGCEYAGIVPEDGDSTEVQP